MNQLEIMILAHPNPRPMIVSKESYMSVAIKILVALLLAGATAAHAQPRTSGSLAIPEQFHGRWAENQRACARPAFTTVITINRRGWSSFEEGGEVTGVGQVRRGTHYFRLHNFAGAEETNGSVAMRREGPRLVVTFDDDDGPPVHYNLQRCR